MKTWNQVPAGEINAANQRLWAAVHNHAEDVAARINTDPDFVEELANFMVRGHQGTSTSQKLARMIMGANFYDIEDAKKHFGVSPTKGQLAFLTRVPYTEEVLRACKDTHILVAVFELSILDVLDATKRFGGSKFQGVFEIGEFFHPALSERERILSEKCELGWYLVRKKAVADSTHKTSAEQQALLGLDEKIPSCQLLVYTITGHMFKGGEVWFKDFWVRTSALEADTHVCVGKFSSHKLYTVFVCKDGSKSEDLGILSVKKN